MRLEIESMESGRTRFTHNRSELYQENLTCTTAMRYLIFFLYCRDYEATTEYELAPCARLTWASAISIG